MTQFAYREHILELSNRLLEIQKPIRILDAIKWPPEFRAQFFARNGSILPSADPAFYASQPLKFDPDALYSALQDLRRDIARKLGKKDALGLIMEDTAGQYMRVIDLLRARGTADFLVHSRALYGSAGDHLRGDNKSLRLLGERLCEIFSLPGAKHLARPYPKVVENFRFSIRGSNPGPPK